MHLLAVFVENKPGQTASITRVLAEKGINICWVTIASSGTFGVMKFLVDKLDEARTALEAGGFMVSLLQTVVVEVPNEPGGLRGVVEALGEFQVNLDNCSGFVANNRAILIIETPEQEKARTILSSRGWRLLTQEELLRGQA